MARVLYIVSEEMAQGAVKKGLVESRRRQEILLEPREDVPPPDEKNHPFNQFLDSVASDMAKDIKTKVLQKLQHKAETWKGLIQFENSPSAAIENEPTEADQITNGGRKRKHDQEDQLDEEGSDCKYRVEGMGNTNVPSSEDPEADYNFAMADSDSEDESDDELPSREAPAGSKPPSEIDRLAPSKAEPARSTNSKEVPKKNRKSAKMQIQKTVETVNEKVGEKKGQELIIPAATLPDQLSPEELQKHVTQGLEKWRRGELFMTIGVGEEDPILEPGASVPDPNNKEHHFNKFLNIVASSIAGAFFLKRSERKKILQLLNSNADKWKELIQKTVEKVGEKKKKQLITPAATLQENSIVHQIELPEELQKHVTQGLEKWRKGELFMTIGVGEEDPILEPGASVPDPNNKEHPFNKFLNSVASSIAGAFFLKRSERKSMLQLLNSNADKWKELIAVNVPTPKMPKEVAQPTNQENPKETMESKLAEKKRRFELARHMIMEDVPDSVKERFGKIFFSKWGKLHKPCLALNPYSIPPGGVRDMWLDMYDKLKTQGRVHAMTNLVYWYGDSTDPANAYSFLPTTKLVSYEAAVKKKLDKLRVPIQKRLDEEKTVPASMKRLGEGLTEMTVDLEKDPKDRTGYFSGDFIEVWAMTTDQRGPPRATKKAKKGKAKGTEEKEPKKNAGGKKRKRFQEEQEEPALEDEKEEESTST